MCIVHTYTVYPRVSQPKDFKKVDLYYQGNLMLIKSENRLYLIVKQKVWYRYVDLPFFKIGFGHPVLL